MRLKSLKYDEYKNTTRAWHLEQFTLGQVNLVVGAGTIWTSCDTPWLTCRQIPSYLFRLHR